MNLLPPVELTKEELKTRLLRFAERVVRHVQPGKRYPSISYRMALEVVGSLDREASDILTQLEVNRQRELKLLEDLAAHFKSRMDPKPQ